MVTKGVWLTKDGSDVFSSKLKLKEAIKFLADHGFNTIFPVMWYEGYTFFRSQEMVNYFGSDYEIHPDFKQDKRDPLEEIVAVASSIGIKVMPWFEFGFASSSRRDGGHIIKFHPQWSGKDQNGDLLYKFQKAWMNSFHPEVQDFMLKLLMEAVTEYKVDGVQGDERLPGCPFTGGYSPEIISEYGSDPPKLASIGVEDPPKDDIWTGWQKFRADLLTKYLARMSDEIKSINSNLKISIASHIYPWGLQHLLQDTVTWINQGLVDMLHPQIYRDDMTSPSNSYDVEVNNILIQFPAHLNLFSPGIAIDIPGEGISNNKDEILAAVEYNRSKGINGEVFFYYEGLRNNDNAVAKALKNGPYN